jgi:hypothetical protein
MNSRPAAPSASSNSSRTLRQQVVAPRRKQAAAVAAAAAAVELLAAKAEGMQHSQVAKHPQPGQQGWQPCSHGFDVAWQQWRHSCICLTHESWARVERAI